MQNVITVNRSEVLLDKIRRENRTWFSTVNMKFAGDLAYFGYYSQAGQAFLVRKTNAWTDMFDGKKKLHYRINSIEANFEIGDLIDDEFKTISDVLGWLVEN